MKCQEIEVYLSGYLDQELTQQQEQKVRLHLETCSHCPEVLNRLEEAKEAYMILMRQDQARADELMTAMKKWLERQRSGASDVSASDLEAFASWVEERASIMGHAAMVPAPGARDWRDRPQTRRPAVAPTRPATR